MKKLKYALYLAVLTAIAISVGLAQAAGTDQIKVPLSDPSEPAFLKVKLINGSIHVVGYQGKEVIVESRAGGRRHVDRDEEMEEDIDDERDARDRMAKRKGMRRITNTGGGLTVEEDHNEVTVSTGWRNMGNGIELTIRVPLQSSMKLKTINDGEITIDGVKGDIEVSNTNGPLTLSDISGSVVADAINDDIKVIFSAIDAKKAMSFSSMNGDIDITLPASVKATLKLKNEMGEIYSDFDMKVDTSPTRVEENRKGKRGRYRVRLDKMMTGTINGGGAELSFKNFNGDIYIRKGK